MGNDRDRHSSQEMDQIQQGLERFLAKEMNGYESLRRSDEALSQGINTDMLPETQRQVVYSEPMIQDYEEDNYVEEMDDGADEEANDAVEEEKQNPSKEIS